MIPIAIDRELIVGKIYSGNEFNPTWIDNTPADRHPMMVIKKASREDYENYAREHAQATEYELNSRRDLWTHFYWVSID